MAHHKKPRKPGMKLATKDFLKIQKKESKQKLKEKRARLVVKNLPFDATEENLMEHFTTYGDITDIQMLKKEDGKALGCAFIQFKLVQKARKAKFHTHGQPFLGRNLDVDFAMPKNKYDKNKKVKQEVDIPKIKEEPIDSKIVEEQIPSIKEELSNEEIGDSDSADDQSEEDEDMTHSENEDSSLDETEVHEKKETFSKPKVISNDVTEGKTIFIKNVPFIATNEDLRECMSQFGPMYYALICQDKFTEHSKGTAFVKFCFKEDAEKALQAGTELTLMGSVLDCHRALNKNEIQSKQDNKDSDKKDIKDSRNLYLTKEGVIMAGSGAAEGVSGTDMAKRLQLEQYKSQMLKNLNLFVSRERLVVHNIPSSWDDTKLRMLCGRFLGKGVKIKEARIMRDFKNVDAKGLGKSKEFGFVTLDSHENALKLLRSLNNNPNVFSKAKRPIVSFSIEKRSAVKTKLKRMERSKMKNPNSRNYNPELVKVEKKRENENTKATEEDLKDFSGITAKPGIQSMRSKSKLKAQAEKHYENLKKSKKQKKLVKKTLAEKKQDFIRQEKQKVNKSKDNDDFSKLVSKYKKTILSAPVVKTKWYS